MLEIAFPWDLNEDQFRFEPGKRHRKWLACSLIALIRFVVMLQIKEYLDSALSHFCLMTTWTDKHFPAILRLPSHPFSSDISKQIEHCSSGHDFEVNKPCISAYQVRDVDSMSAADLTKLHDLDLIMSQGNDLYILSWLISGEYSYDLRWSNRRLKQCRLDSCKSPVSLLWFFL